MCNAFLPVPQELGEKCQGMALANESLMYSRQYEAAFEGFKKIYELLIRNQPDGGRYHKGYSLHQMGTTQLLAQKAGEALRYFTLAYIEDLLTFGKKADELPAAKNLRMIYKVQGSALSELKRIVEQKKSCGQLVQNPNDVFEELARGRTVQTVVQPQEQRPDIGREKRKPGKFESDWRERVFIGGCYSTHLSELNQIRKVCLEKRHDPVLAWEFETPQGKIHHHALMLLHECSKAIFEVSHEAGQLMEIERLRDYGIKPLIVCQKGAHLSQMLEELVLMQTYSINRYSQSQELEKLVEDYLSISIT